MLPIFILIALIGLGLFVYLWPAAGETETFNATRMCLSIALVTYAMSTLILKLMTTSRHPSDLVGWSIFAEVVSWIALTIALKNFFAMLCARGKLKAFRNSSVPD